MAGDAAVLEESSRARKEAALLCIGKRKTTVVRLR